VLSADRSPKSEDVIGFMKEAVAEHGAPEYTCSDSGSEFIGKELERWLASENIKTIDIVREVPSRTAS
jgi:hypothetical protein